MRVAGCLLVLALAAPAAADPSPEPGRAGKLATGTSSELPVAVGVSSPVGWLRGGFGISAYLGTGHHGALRFNGAWYENTGTLSGIPGALAGDGSVSFGRIADTGISWVWYPRRLWQGLTIEAGLLRRARDTSDRVELADGTDTQSVTYAGRAMVGRSWLFAERVFVAFAVGLSVGRESGHETSVPERPGDMPITTAFHRQQIDGEAYLRLGVAFGR